MSRPESWEEDTRRGAVIACPNAFRNGPHPPRPGPLLLLAGPALPGAGPRGRGSPAARWWPGAVSVAGAAGPRRRDNRDFRDSRHELAPPPDWRAPRGRGSPPPPGRR